MAYVELTRVASVGSSNGKVQEKPELYLEHYCAIVEVEAAGFSSAWLKE